MTATRLFARPDDGRLAYVHGGRLGLLDREKHEVAAADLPFTPRWAGFCGEHLVFVDGDELVAYEVPALTERARGGIPAGAAVHAVIGDRLALGAGDTTVTVARLNGPRIDLSTFATPMPPQHVLALEENQLLVISSARNEVVDAISKRVSARLHLALPPPPRHAGTTHGLRYLWTFRSGRPELIIVRLSDGRPFQQVLDAPIRAVHASASGPWIVAITDAGARRVHVQTLAAHPLPAVDGAIAICVVGGNDPTVYWIDAGLRVQSTSLAGQAVPPTPPDASRPAFLLDMAPMGTPGGVATVSRPAPEPEPPPPAPPPPAPPPPAPAPQAEAEAEAAPTPEPVPPPEPPAAPPPASPPPDPFATWHSEPSRTPEDGFQPVPRPSPPPPPAPAPPAPAPAPAPPPPAPRPPAAARPPAPRPPPPKKAPTPSWRVGLAEWTQRMIAGSEIDPPPVGEEVTELALRARLSGDGARTLALLYGAWILGEPEVPLYLLARHLAWDELAGAGTLPRAQLTSVHDGKLRLRPVVARYLDGAAATLLDVHGDPAKVRPDVAPGRQVAPVSVDLPPHASARDLAEQMGAAAIVDEARTRGAAELGIALDEAWLRKLPLLAIPGSDLDAATLAGAPLRADHAFVIVWPDSVVPAVLEALPQLTP